MKPEGIDVPAGMAASVVAKTDKLFHLLLPREPTDALSAENFEAVAEGARKAPGHSGE